jgi:hypothetical protein
MTEPIDAVRAYACILEHEMELAQKYIAHLQTVIKENESLIDMFAEHCKNTGDIPW